ncbi:hypothetical protein ACLK1T_05150 [Escherichia coli]
MRKITWWYCPRAESAACTGGRNRGEACEVVLPASPSPNAVQWQCKEGHGERTIGLGFACHFGYGMG